MDSPPGSTPGIKMAPLGPSLLSPTRHGSQTLSNHKESNYCLYHSERHTCDSFLVMNRMRQQGILCDIVLRVGEKEVHAHRLVLASCSPYFHAMFTSDMSECHRSEVRLHDIDPSAVEQLVTFAYSSDIKITEDNVQYLLPAASLLQLHSVQQACCKFLTTQLSVTNCLGIRRFADTHGCFDLEKTSKKYALQNFNHVVTSDEYTQLQFKEVEELISSEELIASEDEAFRSIIKWVESDEPSRKTHLYSLLRHVRLPLTTKEFVAHQVETHPLVRSSPDCKDLVIEAMKYHLLPEQRALMQSPRTKPRKNGSTVPMLFAIGGGSLFAIHNDCEVYDTQSESWLAVAPMSVRRARLGTAAVGHMIFAVGGYDGTSDLSVVEYFNTHTNNWHRLASMGTKRSCLGIASLNGLLYAVGGYDGASCLNSAERYDPLTDTWTSIAAMATRRRYVKLAVVDDAIYAIGGYDGQSHLLSVEKYDPQSNTWTPMPAMMNRRSSMGVAVVDGSIHVLGGNDGGMCLSNAEKFNMENNMWEPFPSMGIRRSTHDAIALNGQLYVIGGNDGSSSLNSVERFDLQTLCWSDVPAMTTRRSSVGVAVAEVHPLNFTGHS